MRFLWRSKYRAILTVLSGASRHQSHYARLNDKIKNGNVIFQSESIPSLKFSRDEICLTATVSILPKSLDRTFKVKSGRAHFLILSMLKDLSVPRESMTQSVRKNFSLAETLGSRAQKSMLPTNIEQTFEHVTEGLSLARFSYGAPQDERIPES